MPEPLTIMLCVATVQCVGMFPLLSIGYYAQQPSIVHNNTFVYNDTYVKNITRTHIFNEYRIENSTVSITLLNGSSCVIPDLIHGIQRTACTQNTDNPLAIEQFTELATGLNDTVTGVHVTIGSVSKSVHAIQAQSDEIMKVLNSVKVMQTDTFPTILRLQSEMQALQFKVVKKEEEVDRLAQQSTNQKAEIERLKRESTSQNAEIERLTQESTSRQAEIERLTQESTSRQAEIERLTQESTSRHAEIERLTQESTSRQAEIERLTSTQFLTDNKCQTPVPPVAAFKGFWFYNVFLIFLLLWNVFTHQSCDDSKKRLRQWFNMYGSAATENKKNRLAAIKKRNDILTKIKTCEAEKRKKLLQTFIQEIRSMTEHRQRFNVELENFQNVLPELNDRITESLKHLKKFEDLLQERSLAGWSSYDVKLDEGLSAQDRSEECAVFTASVCLTEMVGQILQRVFDG
jgi:predicted  nucleic acid-binding Zn-ribbon protein